MQKDFQGRQLWSLDGEVETDLPDGSKTRSLRQHHDWQRADFPAGYYSPEFKPSSTGGATLVLAHADRKAPAVTDLLVLSAEAVAFSGAAVVEGPAWSRLTDLMP